MSKIHYTPIESLKSLEAEPGLHLLNIQKNWPDLWEVIRTRNAFTQWRSLRPKGLTHIALASALQSITFEYISNYVNNLGPLLWMQNMRGKENWFVEDDKAFRANYFYAIVFSYFLAHNHRLPSEAEFWQLWQQLNEEAMQHNLSFVNTNGIAESCGAKMLAYSQDNNLDWTAESIREDILVAAEYRSKKALTGFVREFYTLLSLTPEMKYITVKKPFVGCSVWWHPLMDIVAKCDGLVKPLDSDQPPVPLAIYLRTPMSSQHIELRKSNGVLRGHLLNVAVDCKCHQGQPDAIYLPDAEQLFFLRMAVGGKESAVQIMRGAYT